MLRELYIRIFKRKQYKESIEVMNKLLGIKKPDCYEIFKYRFKDKWFSLINYKVAWIKNGNKPEYKMYDNGAQFGDSCYDLTFICGYCIFSYVNFDVRYFKYINFLRKILRIKNGFEGIDR